MRRVDDLLNVVWVAVHEKGYLCLLGDILSVTAVRVCGFLRIRDYREVSTLATTVGETVNVFWVRHEVIPLVRGRFVIAG